MIHELREEEASEAKALEAKIKRTVEAKPIQVQQDPEERARKLAERKRLQELKWARGAFADAERDLQRRRSSSDPDYRDLGISTYTIMEVERDAIADYIKDLESGMLRPRPDWQKVHEAGAKLAGERTREMMDESEAANARIKARKLDDSERAEAIRAANEAMQRTGAHGATIARQDVTETHEALLQAERRLSDAYLYKKTNKEKRAAIQALQKATHDANEAAKAANAKVAKRSELESKRGVAAVKRAEKAVERGILDIATLGNLENAVDATRFSMEKRTVPEMKALDAEIKKVDTAIRAGAVQHKKVMAKRNEVELRRGEAAVKRANLALEKATIEDAQVKHLKKTLKGAKEFGSTYFEKLKKEIAETDKQIKIGNKSDVVFRSTMKALDTRDKVNDPKLEKLRGELLNVMGARMDLKEGTKAWNKKISQERKLAGKIKDQEKKIKNEENKILDKLVAEKAKIVTFKKNLVKDSEDFRYAENAEIQIDKRIADVEREGPSAYHTKMESIITKLKIPKFHVVQKAVMLSDQASEKHEAVIKGYMAKARAIKSAESKERKAKEKIERQFEKEREKLEKQLEREKKRADKTRIKDDRRWIDAVLLKDSFYGKKAIKIEHNVEKLERSAKTEAQKQKINKLHDKLADLKGKMHTNYSVYKANQIQREIVERNIDKKKRAQAKSKSQSKQDAKMPASRPASFADRLPTASANPLKGGIAETAGIKSEKQFANRLKAAGVSNPITRLNAGTKVEQEHTKSKATAKEIAMDHLAESPYYYKELGKMEKKLAAAPATKNLAAVNKGASKASKPSQWLDSVKEFKAQGKSPKEAAKLASQKTGSKSSKKSTSKTSARAPGTTRNSATSRPSR